MCALPPQAAMAATSMDISKGQEADIRRGTVN
jgi:hypothetical protein